MTTTRLWVPLLLCLVMGGCAGQRETADTANFTVLISDQFATSVSAYHAFPSGKDSMLDGFNPGSMNLSGGGDGRGALIALGVIIALALTAVVADAAVHNITGVDLSLSFRGSSSHVERRLEFGVNRIRIGDDLLAELRDGKASIVITGGGTRKFTFTIQPKAGELDRDVNYLEFTPNGRIIVNGQRLDPAAVGR